MQTVGTRAQVMHGTAKKTSGGLTSKDLKYNSSGHIVSRKVSALAKQQQKLKKAGYTTVKGQFGAVKIGSKHMKGGDKEYLLTILKDKTGNPVQITLTSTKFMNSSISGNERTTFIYKDNTEDINVRMINIKDFLKKKGFEYNIFPTYTVEKIKLIKNELNMNINQMLFFDITPKNQMNVLTGHLNKNL